MLISNVIALFVVAYFYTNLSKETCSYLKEVTEEGENLCTAAEESSNRLPELSFFQIVTNRYCLVLMSLTANIFGNVVSNQLLTEMIAVYSFNISLEKFSLLVAGTMSVIIIFMSFVKARFTKANTCVASFIASVFSMLIYLWLLMLPNFLELTLSIGWIILVVALLLNNFIIIIVLASARQILLRLVPENSRNFTDGVSYAFIRTFCVIAYFCSGFIYHRMKFVIPCLILATLMHLLLFFRQRSLYLQINPSFKKIWGI